MLFIKSNICFYAALFQTLSFQLISVHTEHQKKTTLPSDYKKSDTETGTDWDTAQLFREPIILHINLSSPQQLL